MRYRIAAITIEILQTEYNDYVNHLISHGEPPETADALARANIRQQLRTRIKGSGIPVVAGATLTVNPVIT